MEAQTTSHSDEISYVETRTFEGGRYAGMKRIEYPAAEAFEMYRKVVQKYQGTDTQILVCLRNGEDELMKSELLNYMT